MEQCREHKLRDMDPNTYRIWIIWGNPGYVDLRSGIM